MVTLDDFERWDVSYCSIICVSSTAMGRRRFQNTSIPFKHIFLYFFDANRTFRACKNMSVYPSDDILDLVFFAMNDLMRWEFVRGT